MTTPNGDADIAGGPTDESLTTTRVTDLNAGTLDSTPSNLTVFNNRLFFTANNGAANGTELWSTDGTTTAMVADINTSTAGASSSPASLTVLGTDLYFTATDGATTGMHGVELWKTTPSGNPDTPGGTTDESLTTVRVADINPGIANSSPALLKTIGTKLVFNATDGVRGIEPWVSDGTEAGTHIIQDINTSSGNATWLTNLNGTVYFVANDGVHGNELWKTDGTYAGTTIIDVNPGPNDGVNGAPAVVNGTLYFLGTSSGTFDSQLFKLDATGAPVAVKNLVTNNTDDITAFTGVNDTLYFVKSGSSGSPAGLYRSDGTTLGTAAVAGGITSVANLTNVNGTLFFTGTSGTTGNELFKVDSASGPEVLVPGELGAGAASSNPGNLVNVGGTLYFTATVGGTTSLYSSNGAGIALVNNPDGVTGMTALTDVNGTLFLRGTTGGTGTELCYVDGTGIHVIDAIAGPTGISPTNLTNANGTLYFSATNGTDGIELWKSNGTVLGTEQVANINPTGDSNPVNIKLSNGLVYFSATDGTSGIELWQTDPTTNATERVMDIWPGINASNPAQLTDVFGSLYFTANNGLSGTEPWIIQGPANVAPTATDLTQSHTILEDSGAFNFPTDIVVSDATPSETISVTLTLADLASGALSANNGASYNGATGVWSISGSVAAVNTALANVAFTPAANWNGVATIGTHVQDHAGVGPADGLITVNVSPVNDAPVNTVPVSAAVTEDVLTPITGISISDVDAGASVVQVTLSVANGTLQVNDTVVGGLTAGGITSNGTGSVVLNGTLAAINATLADATGVQYLSLLNYNGSDTLTVLSDDLGAAGSGGALTDSDPVAITVNAVNDAPVNTVPLSAIADTNVLTPITGISISDVDAGTALVQVTLSVANGTLQVNETVVGGLTATDITGNASGSVVLNGTLAAINATLADATGLRYLSGLDYVGADTLTVLTSDQGATGSGGAQTDSDPVAITVNAAAINDPPVINLSAVVQQTDPTGAVIFNAANGNLISVSDVDVEPAWFR